MSAVPCCCCDLDVQMYESVAASVIFFAVICWGSSLEGPDKIRQDKLIRRHPQLDYLHVIAERTMLSKLLSVMDNNTVS